MTDSQVKYWAFDEDRRHNKEMERYTAVQAEAAKQNAKANYANAVINEAKLNLDIRRYPQEFALRKQEANTKTVGMAFDSSTKALNSWMGALKVLLPLFG